MTEGFILKIDFLNKVREKNFSVPKLCFTESKFV